MGYAQWFIGLVIIVALGAAGWWVKARIDKSYEAEQLAASLEKSKAAFITLDARVKLVEGEKADLEEKLTIAVADRKFIIKTVVRDVVKLVPTDKNCDYDSDVTGLLNKARGHAE